MFGRWFCRLRNYVLPHMSRCASYIFTILKMFEDGCRNHSPESKTIKIAAFVENQSHIVYTYIS